MARPNILMFGDGEWDDARTAAQELRLHRWLSGLVGRRVAVVECGAGTAIPTVRLFSESKAKQQGRTLVRINLRDPDVPEGHVGLALGALEALRAIDARLQEAGSGQ
jgi:hypothetical protein